MSSAFTRSVLVVDDEPGMRAGLAMNLERDGWTVETASGVADATRRLTGKSFSVMITDVRMPDGDGLYLMRQVRKSSPSTAVILLTAYGSVPEAVSAMQEGACHYFTKPLSFEALRAHLSKITPPVGVPAAAAKREGNEILGNSAALQRCLERARHAARANADVLVEAESGTGKELIARFIHNASDRKNKPFVAVNCSAVPEQLLESELFGHTRGAFTGATQNRLGRFAAAEGGTLLLDEIGEMPLDLQPKLLRVLQERQIEPLGESKPIAVDIRVIATTNVSLLEMVGQGRFRADLYYRLNVIPISLPPLRQRREDIPLLAREFAERFSAQAGRAVPEFSTEFMNGLLRHEWPGNIRELSNFIHRVVTLSDSDVIDDSWLSPEFLHVTAPPAVEVMRGFAGNSLREVERSLLEKTLEATHGNRTHAAEMLGVSLRTIRNRIREYGLPPRSFALR
jgi:DNA-binding NtrC family response regulator